MKAGRMSDTFTTFNAALYIVTGGKSSGFCRSM